MQLIEWILLFYFIGVIVTPTETISINHLDFPRLYRNLGKHSTCNVENAKKCLQSFNQQLGTPESVKNVSMFFQYLDKLKEEQGLSGFIQICSATMILGLCEGSQYQACTSPAGLQAIGFNQDDAYSLASFGASTMSQCGAWYDVYYRSYTCMTKVSHSESYHEAMDSCIKNFTESVQKDPSHYCKFSQLFISCLSEPYKVCGGKVAKADCESVKASLETGNDQCIGKLYCQ